MPRQIFSEVLISSGGTGIDVRINGGPLYASTNTEAGDIELVANRWLRSGKNSITARLIVPEGTRSVGTHLSVDITVFERDRGQSREQRRRLLALSYRFSDLAEHPLAADGTFGAGEFDAEVDFPEWSWVSAPQIVDSPGTLASLLRELDGIHALLAALNVEAVAARLRVRDREIALAHYRSEQEQNAETMRDFLYLVTDQNMTLEPRETNDLRLCLFSGGKLARVDDPDGESPIYYLSTDESRVRFVPFVFTLDRERRWVVVR